MAAFTTAVVIASAGDLSMTSGIPISFSVTWGSNIGPFRWSRVWAGIVSPGDEDSAQSVTIQSEGSAWNLSEPGLDPDAGDPARAGPVGRAGGGADPGALFARRHLLD